MDTRWPDALPRAGNRRLEQADAFERIAAGRATYELEGETRIYRFEGLSAVL